MLRQCTGAAPCRNPELPRGSLLKAPARASLVARSYLVANAPAELLRRFPNVASNDASGFSEAVQRGFAAAGERL